MAVLNADRAARVLVVNTGSSSVKLAVVGADDEVIAAHETESPSGDGDSQAVLGLLERLGGHAESAVAAVGHRIVHGGQRYTGPVALDDHVRDDLERLVDLAPLHQRRALAAVDAIGRALPETPAVACFDTAFHATMPAMASTYAVPLAWRDELGVRRFGFHGISHAYAARRAAQLVGRDASDLRIVTCHLGSGASLAAVQAGRCVDTTMGFTPLEGVVMATRSGDVDPGLLLWLIRSAKMTPDDVNAALEHHAGLAGLCGTGDMRVVLERVERGDPAASLALEVYVYRLRKAIAAMAAAMNGVDVLAFTGGVGENAAPVRLRAVSGLAHIGVVLDPAANAVVSAGSDADLSAPGAPVRTLVVIAREDLEISRAVRRVLAL